MRGWWECEGDGGRICDVSDVPPRYREKYLQKVWPHVTRTLKDHVSMQ